MKTNMERTILVVDENAKTINGIREIITEQEDVTVLSARTADVAVELAWRRKPDMVIANKDLIDLSGWDVLGILKKNEPTRRIAFIMLDESSCAEDEARALNLGADDYISKPLKRDVFVARIKAVLRRYLKQPGKESESDEMLKSGDISINMSTHTVYLKGKPVELTPKEFALLYLFLLVGKTILLKLFVKLRICFNC